MVILVLDVQLPGETEISRKVTLDRLASAKIDNASIYTIAGFVAYFISCSPAGMRIASAPLKGVVETTTAIMEARGLLPPPPPQLGNTTLTDLLHEGSLQVAIDPKYPQAIGISSILELTATFGTSEWEILRNDLSDSSFFTSDFPAAIEATDDPRVLNRIVPLAPDLAIRIKPNLSFDDKHRAGLDFAHFSSHHRKVDRKEAAKLNRLMYALPRKWSFIETTTHGSDRS
jgi:hypothetical protein